jgi:quercetin dioxygenase-like cupin family protein
VIVRSSEVNSARVEEVEGRKVKGVILRKQLGVGPVMLLTEVHFEKGGLVPLHKHDVRESVGYVIKGKLRMKIGEKTYVLRKGCSWYHPKNVEHSTEASEDTLAVEIFSPPVIL